MIYLDNAATTKCSKNVVDIMTKYLECEYFNPSSVYAQAVNTRKDIEKARSEILEMLFASDHKLLFVSCATEANNMVFASASLRPGDKILVSNGEHSSVFECAKQYMNKGVNVEFVDLDRDGRVDFDDFVKKMSKDVKLVSIMTVSNETGAINDIKKLCEYAKRINPKVLFASDGVQAFGKIDVCLDDLGVDFFVLSGHKIHGPKGIGALVCKKNVKLNPILFGGGQENGQRSGTENVAGIMGLFEAAKCATENLAQNMQKVQLLRSEFLAALEKTGVKFVVNGNGSPYVLSLSFDGIRGEVLLHALEEKGVLISTGSACSSKNSDNRVLSNMGRTKSEVLGSVRISFNACDEYDVDYIVKTIKDTIEKLKG